MDRRVGCVRRRPDRRHQSHGVGTVEHIVEYGDSYDVFTRDVWPAGLVLLGVGAVGIIATALATAVLTQKR